MTTTVKHFKMKLKKLRWKQNYILYNQIIAKHINYLASPQKKNQENLDSDIKNKKKIQLRKISFYSQVSHEVMKWLKLQC